MIFDPPRDLHKELYERLAAEHKADETDRQSDETWQYDLPDYIRRDMEFHEKIANKIAQNNEAVYVNDRYRWLAEDAEGCIKAYNEAKREAIEESRA